MSDFGTTNFPTGTVRKPPPLQSVLRLQRTVGNRSAQRVLAIGDGRRAAPIAPTPEPVEAPVPQASASRWNLGLVAAILLGALAAGLGVWAPLQPGLGILVATALIALAAILAWRKRDLDS
jgi:hypothetical protein